MPEVRAKFKCDRNEEGHVVLSCVVGDSEENEKFFEYTPAGVIDMTIGNTEAAKQFEVGKEYYVDFTQAD